MFYTDWLSQQKFTEQSLDVVGGGESATRRRSAKGECRPRLASRNATSEGCEPIPGPGRGLTAYAVGVSLRDLCDLGDWAPGSPVPMKHYVDLSVVACAAARYFFSFRVRTP